MSSLYGNNYTLVAGNGQAPIDGPLLVNSILVASALAVSQAQAGAAATGPVAVTLNYSHCGSIIQIPAIGTSASLTINLPIAAQNPGFHCKFIMTDTAGQIISIVTNPLTNGTMNASLVNNTGGAFTGLNNAVGVGCRGVTFTAAANFGDSIEVWTDGIKYVAKGYSDTNLAGLGIVANAP